MSSTTRIPKAGRRRRHESVLVDTALIPDLLAGHGVDATVRSSFGSEALPEGLCVVAGRRATSCSSRPAG